MIFACQVVRKHLIMNKEYKLQLFEDHITIGFENVYPTKYNVEINLKNRISWKVNEKQQISELGIEYNDSTKWFVGKHDDLIQIKSLLANRIFYNSISIFYTSSELIGSGASCKVISIIDKNKQRFAAKCISKDYITQKKTPDRFNRLVGEISILRNLPSHSNVIQLQDVFEGESTYYLVFEFLQGDTLHKYIKKQQKHISEDNIRNILSQLLYGIQHIHQHNYIHRDMKLENVVMSQTDSFKNLKIIDFGLAISSLVSNPFAICGTPGYIAPEILKHKESSVGNFTFTQKVDMFGIGVMLFRMMTRKSLFDSEKTKDLLTLNRKCHLPKQPISIYSNDLNNILFGLLDPNPNSRLSADEALNLMNFTSLTSDLQLSQLTNFPFDVYDDYEVEHSTDYANTPYLFPNKFPKNQLENSFHQNEDFKHSSRSFEFSFSLRLSCHKQQIDFIIEDQPK